MQKKRDNENALDGQSLPHSWQSPRRVRGGETGSFLKREASQVTRFGEFSASSKEKGSEQLVI
jgi:hypothetical protein